MPRRRKGILSNRGDLLDEVTDLERAIADHEAELARLGGGGYGALVDGRHRRSVGAESMTSTSGELMPRRPK